jgi:hypothetical protein
VRAALATACIFAAIVACGSPEDPKMPPSSPIPELDRRVDPKGGSVDGGAGSATPDALKEPKRDSK